MKYIGCHLSITKGFLNTCKKASLLDASTFQYFSRNPRGGAKRETNKDDIFECINYMNEKGFGHLICHAPYTLNPCSDKDSVMEFAKMAFKEDLEELELFPNALYNFHPGSHVGQGIEEGIKKTSAVLNEVMWEDMKTTILLETMAGKGSEVGSTFEELKKIIDNVKYKDHIGVCLDTCHVFDAGYDIVNNYEDVIEEFDKVIGLKYLKAIHLNDSKNLCGSHKDRHELIGKGNIGLDTFIKIINDVRFDSLPMCLETPVNDENDYKKEIDLLLQNIR